MKMDYKFYLISTIVDIECHVFELSLQTINSI